MPLTNVTNIIIPGCHENQEMVLWHPMWRFCGTIFYGYKDDLNRFYDINCNYFKNFLETYSILSWEVTV